MVHIGSIIKKELLQKRWSVADFAKKINTNRNNVYDIFRRSSIDTQLLLSISLILEHDFFIYYSSGLDKKFTTPVDKASKLNKLSTSQFEILNKKLDTLLQKNKKDSSQ